MLPFAEGRQGKEQGGRGEEGGRGPRLFQLRTVLSKVLQTELKAASRQSPVLASGLGTRSEKKYLIRSTC